ncbi:MAG TPA: TIGR03086 family metal-binding protein [Propionibacteriaceae bacterium]|nr:TIGR03086 family metal-binding protein [Propionibacteriaceae bacterium]
MPDTIALLSRALSQLGTLIEQVPTGSLDAATPCSDWTVRELLRHIVRQNLRNFTVSAQGETADWSAISQELGNNWVDDYRRGAQTLLEIWRAADLDRRILVPGAEAPLRSRADHQITELCVHAWDLTMGAQLSVTLDDELAEHALAWSRPMLQPQFRGHGKAFGNEVPVPSHATAYDRLAGWFGRDPGWQPPRPAST